MRGTVNSLILQTSTNYMLPLLLLFSIFLLFGGHNEPGGGFVAGLVAAAAFALYAMAYDVPRTRRAVRVDLRTIVGIGLAFGGASGAVSVVLGEPYLTGYWLEFPVLGLGEIKIGTPLIFDIGVYLVVFSVTLMMILALAEEE